MAKKVFDDLAELNAECISFDDGYSDADWLSELYRDKKLRYITVRRKGLIVGYLLYRILEDRIESVRRGVTKVYRRKGIGTILSKKLIEIADKTGKDIYTYVSKTNLASLNGNLKAGYVVDDIGADWVYIVYRSKNSK